MRLKRVKIFGFKTFADKTEFDVDGDIIAVVGPNGCGKSNIVDAVLWALGEGSPKHLRAATSQDVIFNGSSRRKPLGYAEVTLLFDNEDGELPVQSAEVSVTRKLNRAGESEYFINRHSCRLRDILDLLADSGLGRSGYAIVGQREIDQALSASAEDRRNWVDEAAGVQRYRSRKLDALKRLSSAQDHLSRVDDILKEIENQREPLREEAEIAKRYKSILASLREVESGLLIVDVSKATADLEALQARIDSTHETARKEPLNADRAEADSEAVRRRLSGLERELEQLRHLHREALTTSERAESSIRLAKQRLETLNELEQNLTEETETTAARLAEAEAERTQAEGDSKAESAEFEQVKVEASGAGAEAKKLQGELTVAERELAEARKVHGRRLQLLAEAAQTDERRKTIEREVAGVQESMPELQSALDEATAAVDAATRKFAEADAAVKNMAADFKAINEKETAAGAETREILSKKAALEGRRAGIEATIEAHEGLTQGARAVLELRDKGKLTGSYIPVAEAIEVEKDLAIAIETALGAAANDLIVETESEAKVAIELLKRDRLGRATFQPLPLVRPMDSSELRRLKGRGIVGRAAELVNCKKEYRPVVESLLGRVLVVENLDSALALANTRGWSKVVTVDGEIMHASGAVTGGQAVKQNYGLVQRKADLLEANNEISRLEKTVLGLQGKAADFEKARQKLNLEQSHLESERTVRETELKEAREWFSKVRDEHTLTTRALDKLNNELRSIQSRSHELPDEPDLQGLEERRDGILKALASRSADAERAEQRLREAETRSLQAKLRLEQAQRRLASLVEAQSLRERRRENLGPEREKSNADLLQATTTREQAEAKRQSTEAKISDLSITRTDLIAKSDEQQLQARGARTAAQAATDAAHQAELGRARADAKRATASQRLLEEYGISEEEALLQAPNLTVPADAQPLVSKLRKELKAMGDVNVGAVEAYERLTERADTLYTQREDVLGGIAEIQSSVRELDKLTREKFVQTFEALQVEFTSMFTRLFGGGEGHLSLTDTENILESGIDISVTLPGKKQQRLELLSGGERSLCASAFLFSLLKVKPSPLVVLDEVDAPLDGRNVERFVSALQEFTPKTQFVVITHNPVTIAAAPVWLGVSMQDPGVTTVIPMHVEHAPIHAAVVVEDRTTESVA